MNYLGLLFLLVVQFATGRGLLAILNIKRKLVETIVISMLTGTVLLSTVPMIMEMLSIPITLNNVIICLAIPALVLGIVPFRRYDLAVFNVRDLKLKFPAFYEIVLIALLVLLMVPSIWRNYYYPAPARDVLSGPEALAEYAIKEHTINNSVFSVNLMQSTPNLLKPPFITDLQIIYKLLVHPFGNVWLPILVLSFMVWLYVLIREKLHPALAGFLLLMFVCIPEVYGYTYMMLWDYSNMIFYFAGFYFLFHYLEHDRYNEFVAACIMFGLATFIRVETLIFVAMVAPLLIFRMWKKKVSWVRIGLNMALMMAIPYIFYASWNKLFVPNFLPAHLASAMEESINLSPDKSYFDWFSEINSYLIFGGIGVPLFGYFIYIFLLILALDLLIFRKVTKEARFFLYGIGVIYFGLPILTHFTIWFNITTAKRGLFKMFPLMLMYMCYSPLITRFAAAITNFEAPKIQSKQQKPVVATGTVQQKRKGKKK